MGRLPNRVDPWATQSVAGASGGSRRFGLARGRLSAAGPEIDQAQLRGQSIDETPSASREWLRNHLPRRITSMVDSGTLWRRGKGMGEIRGFLMISTHEPKDVGSSDHKKRLGVANSGKALFGYREAHSSGSNGGGGTVAGKVRPLGPTPNDWKSERRTTETTSGRTPL